MDTISIIIPVYNTIQYINQCLESVCNQTYPHLEIICIDDGSTDGSEKIIDNFAKSDNRIITIHQENHGESNARNIGLKKATGEYIAFLDCDDWIELDMYQKMVNTMQSEDVDIVAGNWFSETQNNSYVVTNNKNVDIGKFNREKLLVYIYERDEYKSFAYMWNKLYKKKLFYNKENNLILFDENLRLGGDVLYLAQLVLNSNNAIYLDQPFYHYRQREDSGCHTKDLSKRQDWLTAYMKLIELFKTENINNNILNFVKRFLAYHCSNVAELAYIQKNKTVLLSCQELMKQYEKIYKQLNYNNESRLIRYNNILQYSLHSPN